ncbi:PorT family protein [bacterium]|nr:PorT family protein [bacterium]
MKKNIFLAAFLLVSLSASPQVLISLLLGDALNTDKIEFGLDGGVNFANIANLETSKPLPLFNLGFYFDIKIKNQLMFHTGVLVKSTQGADKLNPYSLNDQGLDEQFADGYVTRKINQFSVPIMLKYRFAERFHVEAGPMLALRSTGNDVFTNTVIDKGDLTYKLDIKDNYKRIDAGIMAGAGLKLNKKVQKSAQLGVRYYYGLVDPLKDNQGDKQNFTSWYVYFSIPIGAHKAEAKEK